MHRIYLGPHGERADLEERKKMLGTVKGLAVWLSPAGPHMIVAEGIEKVIACMSATGLPGVAAGSSSLMTSVQIPLETGTVTVAADRGEAGEDAAEKFAARLYSDGLEVRIAFPPVAGEDWDECPSADVRAAIEGARIWEPGPEEEPIGQNGAHAGANAARADTHEWQERSGGDAGRPGGGNTSGGIKWGEPEPLPEGLPPVASFDLGLLPETLRPWAGNIVETMQAPPDFAGVTIMTALGTVIGRKIGIRPQRNTGWTETANQWGMVIGRPGILKSPTVEACLAPLKALGAAAVAEFNKGAGEREIAAKIAKLRAGEMETKARKFISKNPDAPADGFFKNSDRGRGPRSQPSGAISRTTPPPRRLASF